MADLKSQVDKVVNQELFLFLPSIILVAQVHNHCCHHKAKHPGGGNEAPWVDPETPDQSRTNGAPGFQGGLATVTVG